MASLLLDGVKYTLREPKEEVEFEEIVKEHSKEIFGNDTLYIDAKKRIESESGLRSTPDGYLIDFSSNLLWIVEVELEKHPLQKHLVVQLNTFMSSVKSPKAQKEIVKAIYSVVDGDVSLKAFVEKRLGSKDIHHFLSELISEDLNIIVVIDRLNGKVKKAFENWRIKPFFVEMKTFVRTGMGIGVHAHLITVPSEWEESLKPVHAIYDEKKKVFLCECGGEAHKNSATYKVGEINKHLLLAHGIPPDEQIIDGWTEEFEKLCRKYFAKSFSW